MPELEGVLDKVGPDVLHAGPIQTCGFMTALTEHHPFLLMSWGSDLLVEADRNGLENWTTGFTLKHADALLCDCDVVGEKAVREFGFSEDQVVKIPWGVDVDKFKPGPDGAKIRQKLGWQDNYIVISTRTWQQTYGIETILEAFKAALAKQPDLRLLLLGDGPLADKIEAFVRDNNLEEVVFRPGIVGQDFLPDYFRAADLYASCSASDGSSVSLLEAMASGLPVIVSDIPGNREWVESDKNGWLAKTGDLRQFEGFLLKARAQPEPARSAMQVSNRRRIKADGNWNQNFIKLIEAYKMISKPRLASEAVQP